MTGPRRDFTTVNGRHKDVGIRIAGGLDNGGIAIDLGIKKRSVEGYVNDLVWMLSLQDLPKGSRRVMIARYFLLKGNGHTLQNPTPKPIHRPWYWPFGSHDNSMAGGITMKSPLNLIIRRTLKEAKTKNLLQPFIKKIKFNGEEHELHLSRRFRPREVSICDRSDCNAGNDCCHLGKLNGLDLCYHGNSRWDVMDGEIGIIFSDMYDNKEEETWDKVRRVLILLERQAEEVS